MNEFNFRRIPVITYSLIGINVIVYLISAMIAGNFMDIDVYTLYKMGGKAGFAIQNGQVWRLFTCMFLHGGLMHIAFNMYALYILGPQLEFFFGKLKYTLIYLSSGLASSLLSFVLGDLATVSVGASGAIFGLLGALLVLSLKNRNRINKGALYNIGFIIVLNLGIGFSSKNIDNFGHIGGLIFGTICTALIVKR